MTHLTAAPTITVFLVSQNASQDATITTTDTRGSVRRPKYTHVSCLTHAQIPANLSPCSQLVKLHVASSATCFVSGFVTSSSSRVRVCYQFTSDKTTFFNHLMENTPNWLSFFFLPSISLQRFRFTSRPSPPTNAHAAGHPLFFSWRASTG